MSKTYIIEEIKRRDNSPKRRWRLHLPNYSEKGYYQQYVSFNCFFYGRYRNWKNVILSKSGGFPDGNWTLYYPKSECQHNDSNDLPIVDVYSIWDFYKIIGYDRERKKWMENVS